MTTRATAPAPKGGLLAEVQPNAWVSMASPLARGRGGVNGGLPAAKSSGQGCNALNTPSVSWVWRPSCRRIGETMRILALGILVLALGGCATAAEQEMKRMKDTSERAAAVTDSCWARAWAQDA